MAEHERSTTVDAPPETLFAFLADVENLPRYFARMTSAHPGDGDEVEVTARLENGREVEGKAWFDVDEDANTIAWGSEGPNNYEGRLEVEGQGAGSTVTVHVTTERADDEGVERGLADTLGEIKRLVEEQGAAT